MAEPFREKIERIILVHLMTGDKTFDELLSHAREIMQKGREIHHDFENAMMSLWVNNQIKETQPRVYSMRSYL